MLGKGTYNEEHEAIHKKTGAKASILIVMEGNQGHGFSVKADIETMKKLPDILRFVADNLQPEIEEDIKTAHDIINDLIEGDKPDAKSTTEDSGSQSFAG